MITRSQIVETARRWKGTPYRHQGRSARGVDCGGFLVVVVNELGLEYKGEKLTYSRFAETFSLKQELDRLCQKVRPEDIQPGDIALFKIDVLPQHVAFLTDYHSGGLGMIHCYQRVNNVVEHRFANVWRARMIQAYQLPGVIDG